MLAVLVAASFTVTPARRAQVIAAPVVEDEPAAARIAPMSRGLARTLRDVDGLELEISPPPTADATTAPDIDVVSQPALLDRDTGARAGSDRRADAEAGAEARANARADLASRCRAGHHDPRGGGSHA